MMKDYVKATVSDIRFPTSKSGDGSDAVNGRPDHSAAFLKLTSCLSGLDGYAFVFTGGRGNRLMCQAILEVTDLISEMEVSWMLDNIGEVSRRIRTDSQLRWLGPDKGVTHMACGAIVNALWDMRCRKEGEPLWRLLVAMEPNLLLQEIDFTYIKDVLRPELALDLLKEGQKRKDTRVKELNSYGVPAYSTAPGWLDLDDETLLTRLKTARESGFRMVKLKVGRNLDEDFHRLSLARDYLGKDFKLAVDANQAWSVREAVRWIRQLSEFNLYWVEEPTSPDDVLGHASIRRNVSPVPIATGEVLQNAVMAKQLLQLNAVDYLQIDATRMSGVNEILAVLLLAKLYEVPICPHAGGAGLCELVQHYSFVNYALLAGDGPFTEYVSHLHEHMVNPVNLFKGRYIPPEVPGIGAEIKQSSIDYWRFPDGGGWSDIG